MGQTTQSRNLAVWLLGGLIALSVAGCEEIDALKLLNDLDSPNPIDLTDPMPPPATTEAVSVTPVGETGNGSSALFSVLSADGRFAAFPSSATNLVAGDTNNMSDVFVHDRQPGEVTLTSVNSSESSTLFRSLITSISADGHFLAIRYDSSSVETTGTYVYDRLTGEATRITPAFPSGLSEVPYPEANSSISADGRFVAFSIETIDFEAEDTNRWDDVFLYDRLTGQTARISMGYDGEQPDGISVNPYVSADGRFIAFQSGASNLVAGDTNNDGDIFVHDRITGETTRVSVDSTGNQGLGNSQNPSISADGRFISFYSDATNLVAGDSNGTSDTFVHDRKTGETTRVSVDSAGNQGNDLSEHPSISADGRFVVFQSQATNLVAGDTNDMEDIFVHDRLTGETTRVSVDSVGTEGNGISGSSSISADGRTVVFVSGATNLVTGDANGTSDTFITPNPMSPFEPYADDDRDGLTNHQELTETFTHYFVADSDGDWVDDGTEVANGTDPLDPASF